MAHVLRLVLISLLATSISTTSDERLLQRMFLSPQFDTSVATQVTAVQGGTARLHCKVQRLNNKMVSWIRSGDLHIMSAGTHMYTTDARFSVATDSARVDWMLMIRSTRLSDSGTYECQVSGKPVISYPVQLAVVVPVTRIINTDKVYLDAGSLMNLTCTVSESPQPATHVFWYHNNKSINYDSARGGVTVVTQTARGASETSTSTVSYLLIVDTVPHDSGYYTCSPSNAPSATTHVHVLSGEKPAAMHTSGQLSPHDSISQVVLLVLVGVHVIKYHCRPY